RYVSYSCYRLLLFDASSTTEIYTLSLHDALPISPSSVGAGSIAIFLWIHAGIYGAGHGRTAHAARIYRRGESRGIFGGRRIFLRSEEHTSELQSRFDLVCRLLLEKKKDGNQSRPE